jgi:16S rRNA (cytosine967-C5)-methyltransferase
VDPARKIAFEVIRAVAERGAYANLLLPALLTQRGLTGRDAALATEICYGTLRGQGSYDAVLAACADRPVADIDPPVCDVLRMGSHQLLSTRVGAHAAVSTSVDLARLVSGPGAARFVNAVLRKVAARDHSAWVAVVAPDRERDPLGHLAVRYSYPRWIVAAYRDALGERDTHLSETEQALAASSARPEVALCAVPGKATQAELVAAGARPARWSPVGAYMAGGDPAGLTAVAAKRAAVQDEASQLAALSLLGVALEGADARWLDLCAGPGGKARLLAGLASQHGARLLAVDIRPHRAKLAAAATSETGSAVVCADGTVPPWRPGSFDRVMADVPCSGLGALRRRPEARWRRSPADVTNLGRLQRSLLASALDAVRPGGVVGYVTCSPHVDETRSVVVAVLGHRDDVQALDAPGVLADVAGLRCPEPGDKFAQFWPHRHGTDAIFIALLRRLPESS